MSRLVVLTTGGTIASTPVDDGGVVATVPGAQLVGLVEHAGADVVEVLRVGSYAMTVEDTLHVARAAIARAADPGVSGVVVTHGTDTLEETAFLTDLLHDGPTPIVFTGAQRHADRPDADGPANLRDAFAVARSPGAAGHGALVCFGGRVDAACGCAKRSTVDLAAFAGIVAGPVASVAGGVVTWTARPPARRALPMPRRLDAHVRIVALAVGDDGALLDAAVDAGARAIVLQAFGLGNANPDIVAAVERATARGTLVAVCSRCGTGPVRPLYGAGGGRDLAAAGALFAPGLPPSQARMLLMVALGSDRPRDEIAALLQGPAGGVG